MPIGARARALMCRAAQSGEAEAAHQCAVRVCVTVPSSVQENNTVVSSDGDAQRESTRFGSFSNKRRPFVTSQRQRSIQRAHILIIFPRLLPRRGQCLAAVACLYLRDGEQHTLPLTLRKRTHALA